MVGRDPCARVPLLFSTETRTRASPGTCLDWCLPMQLPTAQAIGRSEPRGAQPDASLALTALETASRRLVRLELSSSPAGHAVVDGRPHAFELHADEFWSDDMRTQAARGVRTPAANRVFSSCVCLCSADLSTA